MYIFPQLTYNSKHIFKEQNKNVMTTLRPNKRWGAEGVKPMKNNSCILFAQINPSKRKKK